MPSWRSTRQTACADPPTLRATARPSQVAWPAGGGCSNSARICFRKASSYRRWGPGRDTSAQPLQTLADKALPPFDYGVGASVTLAGDLPDPFAGETAHDNPGTFYHLFGFGPTPGEALQFSPVVRTTTDRGRSPSHAPRYTIYRLSVQASTSNNQIAYSRTVALCCSWLY